MHDNDALAQALSAEGPHGKLRGTLLSPSVNSAPTVLIAPGPGPTDRDGNGPGGLRAAIYRLPAQALETRGIASVRIDKRGMFESTLAGDPEDVRIDDYVSDVASWIVARTDNGGIWGGT
ncbi:hypothetical protein [Herbaspirillum robiniae]|uniref:Xaa-Pro dipeptidyl-peptidase-like domain-containing protein n=1 Tax=Herbaspirillum robiniae TaxID=2014887 RepID=A0ABX2LX73_9BURK|nr:hypothetical protein [Herbaspirillum robiniae]NUU02721.1 hypothetical protein [Herbaspirillum robiniae]